MMEWKPQILRELAAIVENYMTAHNKKLSSQDFNAEKSVGAPNPDSKTPDVSPAAIGGIKYFSCGRLGHKARKCFSRVQDKWRKRYCYRCGGIGHTLMQCEKRNRLAHGGAGALERTYKVACSMPIKRCNTVENGRRKEENYRSLSKGKKEIGQKS